MINSLVDFSRIQTQKTTKEHQESLEANIEITHYAIITSLKFIIENKPRNLSPSQELKINSMINQHKQTTNFKTYSAEIINKYFQKYNNSKDESIQDFDWKNEARIKSESELKAEGELAIIIELKDKLENNIAKFKTTNLTQITNSPSNNSKDFKLFIDSAIELQKNLNNIEMKSEAIRELQNYEPDLINQKINQKIKTQLNEFIGKITNPKTSTNKEITATLTANCQNILNAIESDKPNSQEIIDEINILHEFLDDNSKAHFYLKRKLIPDEKTNSKEIKTEKLKDLMLVFAGHKTIKKEIDKNYRTKEKIKTELTELNRQNTKLKAEFQNFATKIEDKDKIPKADDYSECSSDDNITEHKKPIINNFSMWAYLTLVATCVTIIIASIVLHLWALAATTAVVTTVGALYNRHKKATNNNSPLITEDDNTSEATEPKP